MAQPAGPDGHESPPLPERWVRAFDAWQGRHGVVGYPVAVIRKYADDRGSAFAALVTHYGFLALFPLLALLVTGLTWAADLDEGFRDRILDSVVAQLPVIGARLREEAAPLEVEGVVVVVSVLSLLWGATGLYNSGQLVMSQVWNVEGVDRPGFVERLLRSLGLYLTLGLGVVASAGAWWLGVFRPATSTEVLASSVVGTAVLNVLILLVVLRLVTPPSVRWRRLVAPAVLTGVMWEALQLGGHWLVLRQLTRLQDLYGIFGLVLVTIAWLNLAARAAVLAVEAAVVAADGLWPRRIAQPPLTDADREVLERITRNERRRPEQQVTITWDDR
ncbi:YhjD/YihY/BrkB family envelope integrity protein [Euzebya sp.]|uniref:YhjD/YihY/BrkB family envelope integrity protein n=1 Tax=Euzebya sp. TaxID=1971409 RepID=UPI003511B991